MKVWAITFWGSSTKIMVSAPTKRQAVDFYCQMNGIRPSGYIKCRVASKMERYDETTKAVQS